MKRKPSAQALTLLCMGTVISILMMACSPSSEPGGIENRAGITNLAGAWQFHAGDDLTWAEPGSDTSDWTEIQIPTGFGRRDVESTFSWYRKDVDLSSGDLSLEDIRDLRLGITIGKVDSAYQLFVGGQYLGGVGSLPPAPKMAYDRHRTFPLPIRTISPDGRIVIALRVWKAPATRSSVGGPHGGPFLLGPIDELTRRELKSELASLFLAGWFLITALFHLELFRRRPQLRSYLWFALFCGTFTVHSFLRTQWKYELSDRFLVLKEIEHVAIYFALILFIQVVWPLLALPIGKFLRSIQGASLVCALVVGLPGLGPNIKILPIWQAAFLGVLVLFSLQVWRRLREGLPEARQIAVGALAMVAGVGYEVGLDRGYYIGPHLESFCFAFFVACLALCLAGQLARTLAELESLRRSEHAAELANHSKTEFLANMSHEIRTPMTGILGAVDLMLSDELKPATEGYAQTIRTSARSLLGIIDSILDFSRAESSAFRLEHADFSPEEISEGVIDLLKPKAESKDLRLAMVVAPDLPPRLNGDPLRLRQVLINLVANGIKFTDKGGVELELELVDTASSGHRLRFSVRDSGIGIARDARKQLFQPYSQADSSTARRYGGTGLGLAISRRLVELMSGEIEVESRLGKGSTFTVTLPFERAAQQPPRPRLEPRSANFLAREDPFRVLLAEDTPISRLVVTEQLAALGLVVEAAENGLEVLEMLDRHCFDIILMDCQMPELDGYEATRRIRQQENRRHLPIVALTAHAMAGDREKCLAAGMDDYLRKPFTTDQLVRILKRWLPQSSTQRQGHDG